MSISQKQGLGTMKIKLIDNILKRVYSLLKVHTMLETISYKYRLLIEAQNQSMEAYHAANHYYRSNSL